MIIYCQTTFQLPPYKIKENFYWTQRLPFQGKISLKPSYKSESDCFVYLQDPDQLTNICPTSTQNICTKSYDKS